MAPFPGFRPQLGQPLPGGYGAYGTLPGSPEAESGAIAAQMAAQGSGAPPPSDPRDMTVNPQTTQGGGNYAVDNANLSGAAAAAGLNPIVAQDIIWNAPQTVLSDMGVGEYSPMFSVLSDLQGADPASLWLLLNGGQSLQAFGPADYYNWLNSFYGGAQQGNVALDFGGMMRTLLGAGGEVAPGGDPNSMLQAVLNTGGPAERARTLYSLMNDAARISLAPMLQGAYMNMAQAAMNRYLASAQKGSGAQQNPVGFLANIFGGM